MVIGAVMVGEVCHSLPHRDQALLQWRGGRAQARERARTRWFAESFWCRAGTIMQGLFPSGAPFLRARMNSVVGRATTLVRRQCLLPHRACKRPGSHWKMVGLGVLRTALAVVCGRPRALTVQLLARGIAAAVAGCGCGAGGDHGPGESALPRRPKSPSPPGRVGPT